MASTGNRRFVAAALIGAAVLLGLRLWAVEPFTVVSDSMEPTVQQGSTVLLFKWHPPGEARSLVVFPNPLDGALTLKRVVAVEGQEIAIRDAVLFIDGVAPEEPFVNYESIDGTYFGPVSVPKGHVFVLGDNRATSIDSRDFGPVPVGGLTTPVIWTPPAQPLSQLGDPAAARLDDFLTEWCQRDGNHFEVRDTEWNADNAQEHRNGRQDMSDGQPDACDNNPDDIADG